MPRGKKHGPEEVIPKLREAEVLISEGSTQELAAKQIGVTKQTLIRWRKEYIEASRARYRSSISWALGPMGMTRTRLWCSVLCDSG